MCKKTYIDSATRMKLIKRNILNSLFIKDGRTAKNRYSGYDDLIISLFSHGLDSYIVSCSPSSECFTDPILYSGLNSDIPRNLVDAGQLSTIAICYIDGGNIG